MRRAGVWSAGVINAAPPPRCIAAGPVCGIGDIMGGLLPGNGECEATMMADAAGAKLQEPSVGASSRMALAVLRSVSGDFPNERESMRSRICCCSTDSEPVRRLAFTVTFDTFATRDLR